jgi:hypothetical protein
MVSPWVTVILGLGTPVLFQALTNPIRLILGVEAASTGGGMLTHVARSEARVKIASMNTQNLLLAIRTHDCGRMLITLSNVGYL